MKNLRLARRSFVRQLTHNDCGIACIEMILNFAGKPHELLHLRRNALMSSDGTSLKTLRNLAIEFGINAKCVEMEISFLRNINVPVILHTINISGQSHFLVCYGAVKRRNEFRFLLADPAKQVFYCSEKELLMMWESRAGLYFDDLVVSDSLDIKSPWLILLSLNFFPRALLVTVPFLNLCSVCLGISVSWVLQKGLNDSLVGKKTSLILAVLLLLLIVSLSRSLFSYTRQRTMILLSNSVNEQLVTLLIRRIVDNYSPVVNPEDKSIKNSLVEIQKIQNAISILVATLLSDGSLIILILSASFYTLPIAGLANLGYLIVFNILSVKGLHSFIYDYAHLNQLAGASESFMIKELRHHNAGGLQEEEMRINFHRDNHRRYLDYARKVAIRLSNKNFLYECLGTLCLLLTLTLAFVNLQKQLIDYGTFMVLVILSYTITTLMQKIGNALLVVADGAEALVLFKSRVGEERL